MKIEKYKRAIGRFCKKQSDFFFLPLMIIVAILILIGVVSVQNIADFVGGRLGGGKSQTIQYLGLSIVGLLLMIQAIISNKRAGALNDTAKAQLQNNILTLLNSAIDRLGADSSSSRLGAIYALYHLAVEEEQYRLTIYEILCAHLRVTTQQKEYQEEYRQKPSNEIQSLLNLLCKSEKSQCFQGLPTDFEGSYLVKADLVEAQLKGVNLANAQLQEANLYRAQLDGAWFDHAQLKNANFAHAKLRKSRFCNAQLQGAKLICAQLENALFDHAQLEGASLYGAQLQNASFNNARLDGTNFNGAKIQGVYFSAKQRQDAYGLD